MDEEIILPILDFLLTKDIHMDAFIGGKGYTPVQCVAAGQKLANPPALKHYILNTRVRVDNLPLFIHENHLKVQKMTLNFYPEGDIFKDREEVRKYLESNPAVTTVSGGYNNLEFTRADVNKGVGLQKWHSFLTFRSHRRWLWVIPKMISPSSVPPGSVLPWEMQLLPSKVLQIISRPATMKTALQPQSPIFYALRKISTHFFRASMV